jgi:hypothetical protein
VLGSDSDQYVNGPCTHPTGNEANAFIRVVGWKRGEK